MTRVSRWLWIGVVAAVCLSMSLTGIQPSAGVAPQRPLPEHEALKQARMNGKYAMLLRQIQAPKDAEKFKDVHDFGYRNLREYAGHADLPAGYWVYVFPYWYIWRDLTEQQKNRRDWGPEQATGQPDTQQFGDERTAWASRSEDAQDEWLLLEYDEPIMPTAVLVHETYNPGALVKVSVFKLDGTEVEVWKGKDPTGAGTGGGVSEVAVKPNFKTNRVKIYLASKDVAGWNEIDAVGLKDKDEKMHWATAAEASSTYAQQPWVAPETPEQVQQKLLRLQQEIKNLKEENRQLKETLKKLQEGKKQP